MLFILLLPQSEVVVLMVKATVLGGGKQGTRGAEKLVDSIWMPNSENIEGGLSSRHDIESVKLIERDEERALELQERFSDSDKLDVVNKTAEEYIEESDVEGLVYDATDTNERLNTVTEAIFDNINNPEKVAYWSEKPASAKLEDISQAGAKASMDLIENFSLQKQSVIKDIEKEEYEVESVSTWRTSKTDKQVHLEDGKIDWEKSRNLFRQNAGSTKDKGAHDWGNILLTLEATDQDEQIEVDAEESEYKVIEVEKDQDTIVAYTESGEEVEMPYNGEKRLNDGYADIKASSGEVDLRVVTALAGWPEEIEQEIESIHEEFSEGIENKLGDTDLIYGDEGTEEIRVEHLRAYEPESGENVEYLVSTGADMFTLKKTERNGNTNYSLLAEGGTDFIASYLEEGLEALEEDNYDQTVSVDAALRTGEILDRAAETGYENRGEPMRIEAPQNSNLREVLES